MAHREPLQALETGVVLDPRDVMQNFNELAREINGNIDRDNLQTGAVTGSKLESEGVVMVFDNPQEGSPLHTIAVGSTGQWENITGMSVTDTVDDGEIIVDADVNYEWAGATQSNQKCQFRTLVNGVQIAETGWGHTNRLKTVHSMTGSWPVVAGSVTVQVQGRAWNDPWYHLGDVNNGRNTSATKAFNLSYTLDALNIVAGNIVCVVRKR